MVDSNYTWAYVPQRGDQQSFDFVAVDLFEDRGAFIL